MKDFFMEPAITAKNSVSKQETSEGFKTFLIKASFNDSYSWFKILKRIKKYGRLIYEGYWYRGNSRDSIYRGEYRVETNLASRLKKSLTWLQKNEYVKIDMTEL